jgi:hypothetical protein
MLIERLMPRSDLYTKALENGEAIPPAGASWPVDRSPPLPPYLSSLTRIFTISQKYSCICGNLP